MNKNFYCRISLALLTFFLVTKDGHAITVASENEASPLQTLETPYIEPHPWSQPNTIYLSIYLQSQFGRFKFDYSVWDWSF